MIMATTEEERKRLGYKPVAQIKVPEIPALSDDVIKTGEKYSMGTAQQSSSSSSMQGTQSEGTSHNETAVTFDPNAINELKNNISVYDNLFSKSATINPEEDNILKRIGQMRRDREDTIKRNLRNSAGREARKLKYNAWTNFLTSLGNIAGLGNATPIHIDNSRTIESFNRLQDIYDAADNLHNDPTLTWLDRENLARRAAIDAYNKQAEQRNIDIKNAAISNAANRVGYKQVSDSNTKQSGISVGQSSSAGRSVNEGIVQEGMPQDVLNAKSGKGSGEYAVMIGGGKGIPAANLKGLTKAEALFMVTDVLDARKNGGKSSATGKDVGGLLSGKIEYEYKGEKKDYDLGSQEDIDLLMATILGNSGESQVAINTLASKFDKRDKDGIYFNYFNGIQAPEEDYEGNLDGEV
jgi:hypothetical protein